MFVTNAMKYSTIYFFERLDTLIAVLCHTVHMAERRVR